MTRDLLIAWGAATGQADPQAWARDVAEVLGQERLGHSLQVLEMDFRPPQPCGSPRRAQGRGPVLPDQVARGDLRPRGLLRRGRGTAHRGRARGRRDTQLGLGGAGHEQDARRVGLAPREHGEVACGQVAVARDAGVGDRPSMPDEMRNVPVQSSAVTTVCSPAR